MKRFVSMLLALLLVFTCAACSSTKTEQTSDSAKTTAETAATETEASAGNTAASTDPIRIGVSAAITGAAPLDGERSVQGIKMAVSEINAAGGVLGRPLEIVVEDDANDSATAVNGVNKLVSDQSIVALLGPHRSANAMAVEGIVAQAEIPYLTGASSPSLVEKVSNPWLFRIRGSDSFVGQIIGKFAIENVGATKFGVIYNNDDYGVGGRDVVVKYLTDAGYEPLVVEGHNTNDTDMSGAVTKCINAGIDCLIVYTHDPEAAILTRQMNEMGLDVPIVGPTTFSLPTYLSLVTAEETEGFYSVADFVADNPDELVQKFYNSFVEAYDVEPDLFAAAYYNGVYILADAITRAGAADRASIQKALLETKDLPSVYGTLYSNEHGELVHSAVVCEIVDNQPHWSATVYE